MLYKLINKLLFEIAERYNLNYSYNSRCFKLENDNDKISRLSITFMTIGTYAFMIEIDGDKKCLGRVSDDIVVFLLSILRDNLNDKSFPNALKEMCHTYEKIQEIAKELKSDANSTN